MDLLPGRLAPLGPSGSSHLFMQHRTTICFLLEGSVSVCGPLEDDTIHSSLRWGLKITHWFKCWIKSHSSFFAPVLALQEYKRNKTKSSKCNKTYTLYNVIWIIMHFSMAFCLFYLYCMFVFVLTGGISTKQLHRNLYVDLNILLPN